MPRPVINLVAMAGVMVLMGVSPLVGQQQVRVTVTALTNPIAPGGCTRISADVRDELNRQLTLENGVPLQWGSYDYTNSNGTDFEWRSTASGEAELCAKAAAGAASTQITATIKGMPHSGSTMLAISASAPQPTAAPATVPAQPYVPPPAYTPPPSQGYSPPTGATQPTAAAPAPPQQAQGQPVKSAGGFLKKIGSHIKQRAAEVKTETAQNLTLAATQVVDTTFQTGTRLVASTTAEVSNTARMGIGGVGQKLMLAPQRGGGSADNLALAIASGRAVLLEMRFTAGTDVLEPAARELVRRLAVELRTAMATTPGSRWVIEAHVDSVPNAQVLSEYRAAAVKTALADNGVDPARLIALGYGTSRSLQPGGPPVARVEVARAQ